MAYYTGYVTIPHGSYSIWKNATNGNGYNFDSSYGCQCLTAGHFVGMNDGSYKDVKDIKVGEIVSTGNTVVSNNKRLTKVYKVFTKIGVFKVSEDHRFILNNGEECYISDILNKELEIDLVKPKKKYDLTKDELRFLGFYLGDGTKQYRYKNSKIPQIFVTIGTLAKENYLLSLKLGYRIHLHSNRKAKIYTIINKEHPNLVEIINKLNNKDLPRLFTTKQFSYIIEGYIKADGYKKRSQYVCCSINKKLLLSIQYGCFLNGWQAKLSEPLIRNKTNLCKHPKPIYRLSINTKKHPSSKVTKIQYIGKENVYILNLSGNHLYFADNVKHHNCYDLAAEFWWNVGFPPGYPIITASSAYTMWDNRVANASYNGVTYFDLITNRADIKKGDIIVFNYTSSNPYGHVGFADRDYNDSGWLFPEFPILSQNNQGTPDPQGGAYTNVHGYDITLFLGAFRFKAWNAPTPPSYGGIKKRNHFPWVLYARKLREFIQGNYQPW